MRYTTDSFVKALIERFGDRYDLSHVAFHKMSAIVPLVCPDHGAFENTGYKLLHGNRGKGSGCPVCGEKARSEKTVARNRSGRMSQKQFIERAEAIHGKKYDYSLVEFVGIRYQVKIICHKHGAFSQMAQAHIVNGQGCAACFKESRLKNVGNGDFIGAAKTIHGNKYDYAKSDLTKRDEHNRIIVTCAEHGDFAISPGYHLRGGHCQKCANSIRAEKVANFNRLSTSDFIERATAKHGNRYCYKNTSYAGAEKHLSITCRLHGEFRQRASDHINGNGCQKCANFATSKAEQRWLDELGIDQRRKLIVVDGRRFYVDGYDPKTETVYEFLGDYWHGNPKTFDPNSYNTRAKKKFGTLYEETLNRLEKIRSAGYNIVTIWESDYENHLQAR